MQDMLPSEIQFELSNIALIISAIAVLVSIAAIFFNLLPFFQELRNKRILKNKLGLGPYNEATINNSTRYYIRPKCSNLDPASEEEPRLALIATRESLFNKVDDFLDKEGSKRHLIILADSGTGKTSFMLNYYAYNYKKRYPKKRHNLALIPLGAKDSDGLIEKIEDKSETAIFLDAFDEDVKAVHDHKKRMSELFDLCREFKRVIITSRTQFFPKDEEIPKETGIMKIEPRKAGEIQAYELWKLYLSPFDDKEIKKYINKKFSLLSYKAKRKANEYLEKVPLLSVRPMLLAHISDIVTSNKAVEYTYELYEIMVEAWLERESVGIKEEKSELRKFSELMAVELYSNREKRGAEEITSNELMALSEEWGIKMPSWRLKGRSLLNRDADGNYKFAHRSIMEYLFSYRLVQGDQNCFGIVMSDQIKKFVYEMLSMNDELVYDFLQEYDVIAVDHTKCKEYGNILKVNDVSITVINEAFISVSDCSLRLAYSKDKIGENDYKSAIRFLRHSEVYNLYREGGYRVLSKKFIQLATMPTSIKDKMKNIEEEFIVNEYDKIRNTLRLPAENDIYYILVLYLPYKSEEVYVQQPSRLKNL
ncbi:MAG: hypothetical protein MI685_04850 [Chlorobiales bacterium]|nr:hypothetical protein [Chlorobiales bacterium]